MKRSVFLAAAMTVGVFGAGAAQAQVTLYPYATNENYCPTGLQPVVLNGVICCGQPTTSMTYQQVMAQPKRAKVKVKKRQYSARAYCQEGTKGCS